MARPKRRGTGGSLEVSIHKLHPAQRIISEDDTRFRVVMCGRRFGKSALGITEACRAAIDGLPVGWFAPGYKYALEAWKELVQRLGPVTSRVSEQEKRLELITGGVIEVWTLDTQDPARGRKYALVIIDEAGIVRDLTETWQAAIRPTLVDMGGRALVLGTPKGRRHGFIQMFNRGLLEEETDWKSFRASTLDNPFIPQEEIEAARRELPADVFAQEFEGVPLDDGVNPFGIEAIRKSVGKVGENPPVIWGIDLARAQDFTVAVGMDAWRRVVRLERWQSPWAVTRDRVRELVGNCAAVVDATGVGDAIVGDLQESGCMISGFIFTQPSKLRLMQRLIAAFQANELTLPDEGWLLAELESFEFSYTASGVKYEAPKGEHDDGVMALGLALHGWDRVQGVVPEDVVLTNGLGDDLQLAPYGANGYSQFAKTGDFLQQLPNGF